MNDLKISCPVCGKTAVSHTGMDYTSDGGMNGYMTTWRCSECNIDVRVRTEVDEEAAGCIEKTQSFFNGNDPRFLQAVAVSPPGIPSPAPPPPGVPVTPLEEKCKTCKLYGRCGDGPLPVNCGIYEPWHCCETCDTKSCLHPGKYSIKSINLSISECPIWQGQNDIKPPEKERGASPYESLKNVLNMALDQASNGKGKERHAEEGELFEKQQICEITRRVGQGFPLGQAVKKIQESPRLDGERRVDELLGAINYIAASIIVEMGKEK